MQASFITYTKVIIHTYNIPTLSLFKSILGILLIDRFPIYGIQPLLLNPQCPLGQFTGSAGIARAARRTGATVISMLLKKSAFQFNLSDSFRSDVRGLVCLAVFTLIEPL